MNRFWPNPNNDGANAKKGLKPPLYRRASSHSLSLSLSFSPKLYFFALSPSIC